MKQVTRLKTETQLIKRKDNERAYTQALHSILFLSGKLHKGNQSHDMTRFYLKDNEAIPYQYTDTIVLFDGTTREEFYTALVMKDVIHIKICYAYTHTEKSTDVIPVDELEDEPTGNVAYVEEQERLKEMEDEAFMDHLECNTEERVKVLGKIDLDKLS